VDSGSGAGFDIYSGLRDGTAASATGLATLQVNGRYRLYQVAPLTGGAKLAGSFPARQQVVDLAIPWTRADRGPRVFHLAHEPACGWRPYGPPPARQLCGSVLGDQPERDPTKGLTVAHMSDGDQLGRVDTGR
jgi:hypothetical protein